MKDLTEFLKEQVAAQPANVTEGEIKDEKEFREYAEKKLKEAHGDDYDEKAANELVDGILEDNKDKVEKGEWGELVGILNKGMVKKD